MIDTTLPTGVTPQALDSGARAREHGNVVSVTVLRRASILTREKASVVCFMRRAAGSPTGRDERTREPQRPKKSAEQPEGADDDPNDADKRADDGPGLNEHCAVDS